MSLRSVRAGAVIFDLDGTLADTLDDIAAAMNHALALHGLPAHAPAAYRRFIGEGVTRLAEQAGGVDAPVGALTRAFKDYYAEHLLDASKPYPGVVELLHALAEESVPMSVLSNKPDEATRRIVETLFPRVRFRGVMGQRPGIPRKPDPGAALELASSMGNAPERCLFVGDSGVDMQTAARAGQWGVGVLWGFRSAAELASAGAKSLIERPANLLGLLA